MEYAFNYDVVETFEITPGFYLNRGKQKPKFLSKGGVNRYTNCDYVLGTNTTNGYQEIADFLVKNDADNDAVVKSIDDYTLETSTKKNHLNVVKFFDEDDTDICIDDDLFDEGTVKNYQIITQFSLKNENPKVSRNRTIIFKPHQWF